MSSPKKKKGGSGLPKNKGRGDQTADRAQRTARAAAITAIVVAVLFIAALFLNSNFLRQKMTAVSIDNVKYSLTDYNYYFKNMYMQYVQNMSSSGFGAMLPDTQKPLTGQIYDEETGETWYDFFKDLALDQMKNDNKVYIEARKAGYQLSEEDKQTIDTEIESVRDMAAAYGYANVDDYLRAVFGKGMNESYYRKAMERVFLVASYTQYVGDAFIYTQEDLESFYTEKKDSFDTFTYRYFLVLAEDVNREEYTDDEAYAAAQEEALKAAGAKAGELAAAVTDEQSFIETARAYNPELYADDDATKRVYKGELLGSIYGDWMKEPARKAGDVSTFETSTGYYVVYFGSRSDNHYDTVNVQMMLVAPRQVDPSLYAGDDAAYDAALEQARKDAGDLADKIYNEWRGAGATQEKLTELTEANADVVNAAESVLKENVYRTQLPEEVDGWIYDPARKTGDHTLVYAEAAGYYLLYFAGAGEQYSDVLAENGKRELDLNAWLESLPVAEPKTTWLLTLAKA